MKIEPLRPAPARTPALLFPGHRRLVAMVPEGTHSATGRHVAPLLAKLKGHTCYVGAGLLSMRFVTSPTHWTAYTWRDRATRIVHEPSGCTVTSLRGALEEATDPDHAMGQLLDCLTWLHAFGVGPASIPRMAWNLWRATLRRPVTITADPGVAAAGLYGGRQGITRAGTFRHMVALDIEAAYPSEMASAPFGLRLRPVSPSSHLEPDTPGLARARVRVPADAPFPPLPVRLAPAAISFQRGLISGVWPWRELAAVQGLGFEVDVVESWAPRATADLFTGWWGVVQIGRDLPGPAAKLAKAIANSTWGQFAMSGESKGMIRWEDDRGERSFVVDLGAQKMPHRAMAHIAAETTARVRSRLLTGPLYGWKGSPVHMDTDGVIMRRRTELPAGRGPGHWRQTAAMRKVDVRAPQLYRYQCQGVCCLRSPEWHYVAAGVPADMAPQVFRKEATESGTLIADSRINFDLVLPPTDAQDKEGIRRWLTMAGVRT